MNNKDTTSTINAEAYINKYMANPFLFQQEIVLCLLFCFGHLQHGLFNLFRKNAIQMEASKKHHSMCPPPVVCAHLEFLHYNQQVYGGTQTFALH